MAEQQRYLLLATAEIDPEQEADWNCWYDTVNLPALSPQGNRLN
jgi:hypothetical protein